MGSMSVRNIPDDVLKTLKKIAAANNRSAEAEVRQAIANLVRAQDGKGFGQQLHARLGGLIDQDFQFERDPTTHEPLELG